MKVVVVGARLVGAAIGMLVVVPSAVLWLVEMGKAGSWTWLPACLALVAGLAGCAAALLWWPHRRVRVVAGLSALAWGTLAVSFAYWPGVTTRAEIRDAYERVDHVDTVVDPTIWELGGAWCAPGFRSVLGCPRLSAGYLVSEGEGEAVVRAMEEVGFKLVGEAEGRPIKGYDLPGSGSTGLGSRYWLKDEEIRIQVTVISDELLEGQLPGPDGLTAYFPSTTERVDVEITDAENPQRLGIPDELGFWAPYASLDDMQPPADW